MTAIDSDSGLPARFQRPAPVQVQRVQSAARPAGHHAAERAVVDTEMALALVQRVKDGDSEAFGQLFDHYHPLVYPFIYRMVQQRQVAEDLTSDTFLRVLDKIERFTWQGRDPGAWIMTIARNIVYDHQKKASTRREVRTPDFSLEADRQPAGSIASDPAAIVVDQEINRELYTALGKLTGPQREVVILRFLHGLSTHQVAALMGENQQVIKARQYRGIRTLKQLLPSWTQS